MRATMDLPLLASEDLDDELPPLIPVVGDRLVELTVRCKVEGQRLDQYLAGMFTDFSRSIIQKGIEQGQVTVNGQPAKASYKIRNGDRVRFQQPEPTHAIPV